jgi:hypothetical protein
MDALGNGSVVWSLEGAKTSRFVAEDTLPAWSDPATTLSAEGASSVGVGLSGRGAGIAAWSGASLAARRFDF